MKLKSRHEDDLSDRDLKNRGEKIENAEGKVDVDVISRSGSIEMRDSRWVLENLWKREMAYFTS